MRRNALCRECGVQLRCWSLVFPGDGPVLLVGRGLHKSEAPKGRAVVLGGLPGPLSTLAGWGAQLSVLLPASFPVLSRHSLRTHESACAPELEVPVLKEPWRYSTPTSLCVHVTHPASGLLYMCLLPSHLLFSFSSLYDLCTVACSYLCRQVSAL